MSFRYQGVTEAQGYAHAVVVAGGPKEPDIVANLPAELRDALDRYARELDDGGLSPNTRRVYRSRVSNFLSWLAAWPEPEAALTDPHARNAAVAGYQRHLTERGRTASAVNAIRVAVDDFYRQLGLGAAVAPRYTPAPATATALDQDALAAVDAVLSGGGPDDAVRRRAVVQLMCYAGLNGAEVAALDVDDVEWKGDLRVHVRGPRARTVPLHPELASALRAWRKLRDNSPHAQDFAALFPNRAGRRLSARSITGIVQEAGERAGVPLSPDRLRATFAAALRQAAVDPAVVAVLTGRRAAHPEPPPVPSPAALRAAMHRLGQRA